jgi:hypothetical protein
MVIGKYQIITENIYNFNEKRFLMGYSRSLKRIMTKAALELGCITKAKQDGSREFISILACVMTATEVGVRAIQDHKVIEWNTCWKCRL